MEQASRSKQILLAVIGISILVVAVVGVTFAFFNYTRTGGANTISTGNITFSSEQSTISITNVFPIATSSVATDANNVGTATVTIAGNTSYANGIQFRVTAQNVSSNIGTTTGKLPISVQVTAANLGSVTALDGTGTITLNSYENGTTIANNSILASGRIPGNTNVNGTLTIKAYIDASLVAITDTVSGGDIVVSGYTNGTTSAWINGRTVMTTDQWNALAVTPASFKIRVEAIETGGNWAYSLT